MLIQFELNNVGNTIGFSNIHTFHFFVIIVLPKLKTLHFADIITLENSNSHKSFD